MVSINVIQIQAINSSNQLTPTSGSNGLLDVRAAGEFGGLLRDGIHAPTREQLVDQLRSSDGDLGHNPQAPPVAAVVLDSFRW